MEINVITADKFTKEEWESIEKPITVYERQRNQILVELAEEAYINNSMKIEMKINSGLVMIGDYNYLWIREEIEKYIKLKRAVVEVDMSRIKDNKRVNYILENNKKLIIAKMDMLRMILEDKNIINKKIDDMMINFNYLEMRIIILMKMIERMTKEKIEKIRKDEILIASKKIIYNIKRMYKESDKYFSRIFTIENFEINISEQMIIDLEYKIGKLQKVNNMRLEEVANERPELMFNTRYEGIIPIIKLKPYDSQIRVMEIVKNGMKGGFMILYKALPGVGKTSMV